MLACLDVDYRDSGAVAACLLFDDWTAAAPGAEVVVPIAEVAPYQPGKFYLRELPCLLAVLAAAPSRPEIVLVDGYVWLGDDEPGLGAHLYEALGRKVAVVGVAKTRFARATAACDIRRGKSHSPLHVTAAGMDLSEAARHVKEMHGPHRIPTLLKRVDRLCRDWAPAAPRT
jgi:deoxyribonuclease V